MTLAHDLGGLASDTLHRWRARVLHAPFHVDAPGITEPPNPLGGPWRRYQGQTSEADVRTLPEPGAVAGLLLGGALLAALSRRRRAGPSAAD